jgi:hypothetical protein
LEREVGLKELADLRDRRVSESKAAKDLNSPTLDKNANSKHHNELPIKGPMSHAQFKDLIGKVKVKSDLLVIDGLEHLGVIHDMIQTDQPQIYRFFGDRYIAKVSFETILPAILDMKEITERSKGLLSNHQMYREGRTRS